VDEEGILEVASRVAGAKIAVGVRSRVGEPGSAEDHVTIGVLVDSALVAFPIDQEGDFRPVEVESVIATVPLDATSTVERIPGTQVDILVLQGPVAGRPVAFVTLAHACTQLHNLPETSQSQLVAAMEETGDLWSAVIITSGRRAGTPPELPDHIMRRGADHEISWPRPTVRTRPPQSSVQVGDDLCKITPRCL